MNPKVEYKFTVWVGSNEFQDEIPCVNWPQVEAELRRLREANYMYGEFRAEFCYVLNSEDKIHKIILG